MRPTLATGLSLAAVLVAGALAAAANFRVLAGPDGAASASTVGTGAPSAVEGPQTVAVGNAGSLTLDETGGLHLVRAQPASGWQARQRPAPAGTVVVAFQPAAGPAIVVSAARAGGGIHVVAHEETTTAGRAVAGDDLDEDDD
ncbi:MAG TPA: hypothetical protein VH479_00665 [Acidimicrobiales bacterium]|jgi:hypothetical protein